MRNISRWWRSVREPIVTVSMWISGLIVLAVFVAILGDILVHGLKELRWEYIFGMPERAGREGGIVSIIVTTFLILAVAMAASLPVGVGCAIYLSEFTRADNLLGRIIRRSLDILAGIPSIVFGLFGMAFFCQFLGWGWSILSGGLTLACMVLPMVIRASEEGLRAVPDEYRAGGAGLGISKGSMLWHILLPCATPGIMAGLVLGIGRALAETAAVMYTAGASIRMPTSLFSSGRTLSYHIYIMSIQVPGGTSKAYAGALVLIVLLLAVNTVAYVLSNRFLGRRVYVHE